MAASPSRPIGHCSKARSAKGAGAPDLPRRVGCSGGDQEEGQVGTGGVLDRFEEDAPDLRRHRVRFVQQDDERSGGCLHPRGKEPRNILRHCGPLGGCSDGSELDAAQAGFGPADEFPELLDEGAPFLECAGGQSLGPQPQVPGASGDAHQQHRLPVSPRPVEQDALRGSGPAGEFPEPPVREREFRFPPREIRRHLPRPRPERVPPAAFPDHDRSLPQESGRVGRSRRPAGQRILAE